MSYKLIIYVLSVMCTTFALSGLNINSIFKKGHIAEANFFIIIAILAISELVSSFIINFLEDSKIL